jgi:hypothetical protein
MRPGSVALLIVKLTLAIGLIIATNHTAVAHGRWVALVVGNSAYRSIPTLENPENDARLIASTLRALGFTLIGGGPRLNLDKARFDAAVRAFGQFLPGAEVALFYYAGHGMQVRGENWLVPVDANPRRMQDLDFQMVDAQLVLKQMEEAGTRLNVVILNACRNNPFGGRGIRGGAPGLAEMRAPPGTLISYATQPGNVAMDGSGADSPYTLALVNAMRQPGLDVLSMFNRVGVMVEGDTDGEQQPWLSSSPIAYDFALSGLVSGSVAAIPETPIPPHAAVATTAGAFAGLPERIALEARAVGIPLAPSLDFVAPSVEVSAGAAKFVGAWGPGHWHGPQGAVFGNIIVAVSRVDVDGTAHLTVMQDAGYDHAGGRHGPIVTYIDGRIEDGALTFQSVDKYWRFVMQIGTDGRLYGECFVGTRLGSRIELPRIQ